MKQPEHKNPEAVEILSLFPRTCSYPTDEEKALGITDRPQGFNAFVALHKNGRTLEIFPEFGCLEVDIQHLRADIAPFSD